MLKKYTFLIGLLIHFYTLFGQSQIQRCNSVMTGTFYFYPPQSTDQFLIIRNDSVQKEINMITLDTSFWEIISRHDCVFKLKFLKTTKRITNEQANFLKSHPTIIEVTWLTTDYYLFSATMDSIPIKENIQDTIWRRSKLQKNSIEPIP